MPNVTKRKTRVTKEAIKEIRKELSKTSYQRKKVVNPGPYTQETNLRVPVNLLENKSFTFDFTFMGSYVRDMNWNEKGWYPIIFNIVYDEELLKEHGIDNFLAALEKSMSEEKINKKKKYGTVIITNMLVENKEKGFISIKAKTNKKNILGFKAFRKNEFVRL